ncbi:MAG: cupin domain-containing protein [Gemmatimonadaceae bacterium]
MPTFRRNQVFAIALSACVLSLFASLSACGDRKDSVGPGTESFSPGNGSHTMGVGSTSTPLGRATFVDPKDQNIHVKRISGDWHMEIKSKPAFDIAIQSIVFQPGGQSGWHRHPGPVFIQVVSGTMTFYESDDPTCTPIVRTAGQGYLDLGEHAHIARNESGSPAQNVVTYFAPPGAALRIDASAPGNCSF